MQTSVFTGEKVSAGFSLGIGGVGGPGHGLWPRGSRPASGEEKTNLWSAALAGFQDQIPPFILGPVATLDFRKGCRSRGTKMSRDW